MLQQGAPECIGVIVDGNRRWARERSLPTIKGHQAGYEKLKEMADWATEAGIKYVIAYVFSTENMKRSEEEVSYLMDLTIKVFTDDLDSFKKKNARIHIAGDVSLAPKKVQEAVRKAEEETKMCDGIHLVLAFYYGGRHELISAIRRIQEDQESGKLEKTPITEETIKNYLWTKNIPDPELIIRTSGEMRLSNFLTWQGVYSELFFPKFYFPDFTREAFNGILKEYAERQRRFGK